MNEQRRHGQQHDRRRGRRAYRVPREQFQLVRFAATNNATRTPARRLRRRRPPPVSRSPGRTPQERSRRLHADDAQNGATTADVVLRIQEINPKEATYMPPIKRLKAPRPACLVAVRRAHQHEPANKAPASCDSFWRSPNSAIAKAYPTTQCPKDAVVALFFGVLRVARLADPLAPSPAAPAARTRPRPQWPRRTRRRLARPT